MKAAPALTIPKTVAIKSLFLLIINIILSSMFTPRLIKLLAILLAFLFNSSYVNSLSSAMRIVLLGFSDVMFSNMSLITPSFASLISKSSSSSISSRMEMFFNNSSDELNFDNNTLNPFKNASINSLE